MAGKKALTGKYCERLIPMWILLTIYMFLCIKDINELVLQGVSWSVTLVLAGTAVSMYIMMRREDEYQFINSLPITKGLQWRCLYGALITLCIFTYVMYAEIIFIQCDGASAAAGAILASTAVKLVTSILIITFILWFMSHKVITGFGVIGVCAALAYMLIFGSGFAAGLHRAIGKGNNILYSISNIWNYMNVPLENYKELDKLDMYISPVVSVTNKTMIIVLFIVAVLAVTVTIAHLSRINYEKNDLSCSLSSIMVPFNKVLITAVFVIGGILPFGAFAGWSTDYSYSSEYNEHGEEYESVMYKYDSNTVTGNYYEFENDFYRYKIYDIKVPSFNRVPFITASVIGGAAGAALAYGVNISMKKYTEGGSSNEKKSADKTQL